MKIKRLLAAVLMLAATMLMFAACAETPPGGLVDIAIIIGEERYELNVECATLGEALDILVEREDLVLEATTDASGKRMVQKLGDLVPTSGTNEFVAIYSTIDDLEYSFVDFYVEYDDIKYYSANFGIDEMPVVANATYLFEISSW